MRYCFYSFLLPVGSVNGWLRAPYRWRMRLTRSRFKTYSRHFGSLGKTFFIGLTSGWGSWQATLNFSHMFKIYTPEQKTSTVEQYLRIYESRSG